MDDNKKYGLTVCFFGDVAARHLLRWSLYFAKHGYRTHVITFNDKLVDDYGPVDVHVIQKRFHGGGFIARALNILPILFKTKQLLNRIKPDIIHGQDAGGNSWIAALTGFHPFIVTPWGSDILIHPRSSTVTRILTRFALQKADLIVCDGENTKEEIRKSGIPSYKIKLFTFGVDVEKFKPLPGGKNPDGSKIVISTRFLTEVHNLEALIMAIPTVIEEFPKVKFVLIGDGDKKESLEKLSGELGIADFVEFAGRVTEKEMVSRFQAADVYVSTSLSESGLAASTAEAMACELPVVNTDTGDIRLWIKDGEGGFVVPVKEPAVLAHKIIYLLKNSAVRTAFGKRHRTIIEEKNNYYCEMDKIANIYKELFNHKK
jgi:Glycosyltransferase